MTNVSYFRKLVVDETAKLNGLCDKWTQLAAENENIPETSEFDFFASTFGTIALSLSLSKTYDPFVFHSYWRY